MKHTISTKVLALVLSVLMVVGVVPAMALVGAAVSEPKVVIACSDFQAASDAASAANVTSILNAMKTTGGYTDADALIFCGDVSVQYPQSASAAQTCVNALKNAVTGVFPGVTDFFLTQGNHDQITQGTGGLTGPGAHDTADYGVYLIDEDDYMWYNNNLTRIQSTASALDTYLQGKAAAGYTKPIFVASHLPLHYSSRTVQDGDCRYAQYLFDVLNAGAAQGLNIIFLFGHDHSHGWDKYLGGDSIYLAPGDSIYISDPSDKSKYEEKTLGFTYMNAGYVGYFNDDDGSTGTLTATVFTVDGDQVKIERYDGNGLHNLKSAGTHRSQGDFSGCQLNTQVYGSPQYVTRSASSAEPVTVTDPVTGVSVATYSGSAVAVTEKSNTTPYEGISSYRLYDITVSDFEVGSEAVVSIPVPAAFAGKIVKAYWVNGNELVDMNAVIASNTATFTTTHFSDYMLAALADAPAAIGWVEIPGSITYTYTLDTDGVDEGEPYLIVGASAARAMMTDLSGATVTISNNRINLNTDAYEWVFHPTYTSTTVAGSNTNTPYTLSNPGNYYVLVGGEYKQVTSATRTRVVQPQSGVTCNNLISRNSTSWTQTSYYYTPDNGANYYRVYAQRTSSGSGTNRTYTYTWGYRTSTYTTTTTTIGTQQTRNMDDIVNIPLFNSSNPSATYTWTINYDGGSVTQTAQGATLYTVADTMTITNKNGRYLYRTSNTSLNGNSTSSTNWTVTNRSGGSYRIYYSRYVYWGTSAFGLTNSTTNVRLFKRTGTTTTPGKYAGLDAEDFTFTVGRFASTNALNDYLKNEINVYLADSADGENMRLLSSNDYTITGSANPSTAGTTTYTVSYGGVQVGSFRVTIANRTATGIRLMNDNEGTVFVKSPMSTGTSSFIYVDYSDGSFERYPISLSMLSPASAFDLTTIGDYTDLTVNYTAGGTTFTTGGYTLHVINRPEPAYPQGGSVRVGKSGNGINFSQTGVANIELTASGIPLNKGIDVIVMIDTSSTMGYTDMPGGESRISVVQKSLSHMLEAFKTPRADGSDPDIRLAVGDFNGYTQISSGDAFRGSLSNANNAAIFTGSKAINAGAFVDVTTIDNNNNAFVSRITAKSGTNYDYAFDTIYRLGSAIRAANAEAGEERELIVIFMSDGCPHQFNYYTSQNAEIWNYWVLGTMAEHNSTIPGSHQFFYNEDGDQWMANAIKGDPTLEYTVIDPTRALGSSANVAGDTSGYMRRVPGLGATMYTIGFALAEETDDHINIIYEETPRTLIPHLASTVNGEKLFYNADNQEELNAAFSTIARDMTEAATDAYFLDTMGVDYDIQLASYVQNSALDTPIQLLNGDPLRFTVSSYEIYNIGEVNGSSVTLDMVGTRKPGDQYKTNLETVTFSLDGTSATSDKKSGECIVGDLIIAKTFTYNMSKTTPALIDTNGDGVGDFELAPETFYWTIGTLHNNEVALSYYVYLTGTMEGTRDAGTYPTNESAVLHYINWVGEPAEKETITPRFSWKAASVSYAFYLVNAEGQTIDAFGRPTGFANRQQVGTITYYDDVKLNELGVSLTVDGLAVLPDGYSLYDNEAAYSIYVSSSQENCRWIITNGDGKTSTYVTRYHGADFTNEEQVCGGERDDYGYHPDYAFTDTVVWFAMLYNAKAQDDVVVIDYGLPVDITVLANDLPISGAAVAGISATLRQEKSDATVTGDLALDSRWNNTTLTFAHGSVTVNGNRVRYTPSDLEMDAPVSFSYAMSYTEYVGNNSVIKYLYANVTVVPATVIYYETDGNMNDAFTYTGAFETLGETTIRTQAEDRPGPAGSFGNVDADNLYGYDNVYERRSDYSGGEAKLLTGTTAQNVNGEITFATSVSFTFTGTGFDVISRTGANDGAVRATIVNTETGDKYYVNVINKGEIDSLKQIPVISYNDLPYGTYTVTVGVYGAMTSIGVGNQFIFDAVRIFDPAKESEDSGTSYLTQRGANYFYALDGEEDPTFVEPRNLMIAADALTTDSGDAVGIAFVDKATYPESNPPQTDDTEVTDHVVYAVTDYYTSETLGHGPNDEIYLASGQAIAFSVDLSGVTGLHMGAKTIGALGDGSVSLGSAAGLKVTVKLGGKAYITANRTITSPTDLKFDIFEGVEIGNAEAAMVVVENTGAGVLSITDLKVIHGTPAEEPVASANPFFVNAATATFATAIMEDVKGDVNFDGVVTIQDTTEMLRSMSESTMPYGIDRVYDVNGDGVISIRDVTMLLGIISGN